MFYINYFFFFRNNRCIEKTSLLIPIIYKNYEQILDSNDLFFSSNLKKRRYKENFAIPIIYKRILCLRTNIYSNDLFLSLSRKKEERKRREKGRREACWRRLHRRNVSGNSLNVDPAKMPLRFEPYLARRAENFPRGRRRYRLASIQILAEFRRNTTRRTGPVQGWYCANRGCTCGSAKFRHSMGHNNRENVFHASRVSLNNRGGRLGERIVTLFD